MRSPVAWLSACSCAVVLAGCGGEEARPEPTPALPAALAERLARDADQVASRVDAADPCGALAVAARLRTRAIAAVNGPAVPAPLKEELLANAQLLHDRTAQACAAAETPDEEDEDGEGENGGGRGENGDGEGDGNGNGNDEDKEKDKGERKGENGGEGGDG
jgi:hypothetical protein